MFYHKWYLSGLSNWYLLLVSKVAEANFRWNTVADKLKLGSNGLIKFTGYYKFQMENFIEKFKYHVKIKC